MHHNRNIVHRLLNEGGSTVVCDSLLASHHAFNTFCGANHSDVRMSGKSCQ